MRSPPHKPIYTSVSPSVRPSIAAVAERDCIICISSTGTGCLQRKRHLSLRRQQQPQHHQYDVPTLSSSRLLLLFLSRIIASLYDDGPQKNGFRAVRDISLAARFARCRRRLRGLVRRPRPTTGTVRRRRPTGSAAACRRGVVVDVFFAIGTGLRPRRRRRRGTRFTNDVDEDDDDDDERGRHPTRH